MSDRYKVPGENRVSKWEWTNFCGRKHATVPLNCSSKQYRRQECPGCPDGPFTSLPILPTPLPHGSQPQSTHPGPMIGGRWRTSL